MSARVDREPHSRLLLQTLTEPASCAQLDLSQWDLLLRTARAARLLGVVGILIRDAGAQSSVPPEVTVHFTSQSREDLYRCAMAELTLQRIERSLANDATSVVLLKGAAYIARALPWARSRIFSDIDLMVARSEIDATERALREDGWTTSPLDPYDERYYREWGQEIPPLSHEQFQFEVDLHHTILPLTGRLRPDADRLIRDSAPLPGTRFRVLGEEDQFIHTVLHLVHDSDMVGGLRDLVDVWLLGRHFGQAEDFAHRLVTRARLHGVARPLWWALHYVESYLQGNAFTTDTMARLADVCPPPMVIAVMDAMVPGALFPPGPTSSHIALQVARLGLLGRYQWMRMPPLMLARHILVKSRRAIFARESARLDA